MKRVYQVSSLALFVFAGVIALESSRLRYYSVLGPGPGFFPLWLSGILGVFTLLWLIQVTVGRNEPVPEGFFPSRWGATRVVAVCLSLVFMVLTMDWLGFCLSMFLVLAFLLYALGRQSVLMTLVVSLLGSFGFYFALINWLGGYLPPSMIPFLASLGY